MSESCIVEGKQVFHGWVGCGEWHVARGTREFLRARRRGMNFTPETVQSRTLVSRALQGGGPERECASGVKRLRVSSKSPPGEGDAHLPRARAAVGGLNCAEIVAIAEAATGAALGPVGGGFMLGRQPVRHGGHSWSPRLCGAVGSVSSSLTGRAGDSKRSRAMQRRRPSHHERSCSHVVDALLSLELQSEEDGHHHRGNDEHGNRHNAKSPRRTNKADPVSRER